MKTGGTRWDETKHSVDAWNLLQTLVKPVLVCSVDRALDSTYNHTGKLQIGIRVTSVASTCSLNLSRGTTENSSQLL